MTGEMGKHELHQQELVQCEVTGIPGTTDAGAGGKGQGKGNL